MKKNTHVNDGSGETTCGVSSIDQSFDKIGQATCLKCLEMISQNVKNSCGNSWNDSAILAAKKRIAENIEERPPIPVLDEARLIAKAPELLDIVERLVAYYGPNETRAEALFKINNAKEILKELQG